ncbi:MAG: DUF4174 domain-containing protein [Guyparkeria sp.]
MAGLAATVALFPLAAGAETYWDKLEWQVRPLVLVEGGTHSDREADHDADHWVKRLEADRCALAERRIHWLVIDADGAVWRRFDGSDGSEFEATQLDRAAADVVRDRLGWSRGDPSRLVLFGLDGQEKYRGRPDALQTIWSLIDRMPMRRTELAREPDDCGGR